jgi:restriction system protein
MARRPKTSPLEDFVGLVALMPWWACVGLALLSYLVLSTMARPVVMTGIQPNQVGQVVTHAMFQGLAMVGQFVVPILCLAAAAVSAAKRQQRRSLVASVAQGRAPDALDGMTWQEFELLVGEAFRLQGYDVTELGGAGPDGGVDLVLRRDKEKFFVQCKQWKAFKVGVQVVRELYGVMAARGAAGGFVVTSGSFTEEAIAFASGRNVKLVDGPKLFGLIQQAKVARQGEERTEVLVKGRPVTPFSLGAVETAVVCPTCSSAMVRRVAKRGENAGKAFWGCTGYPSCRGTRPMDGQ